MCLQIFFCGTCCQDPVYTTPNVEVCLSFLDLWTYYAPILRPALLLSLECDGTVPLAVRSLPLPALVSPLAPSSPSLGEQLARAAPGCIPLRTEHLEMLVLNTLKPELLG